VHLRSRAAGQPATVRVHVAFTAVWLGSLSAAVRTLLGDGGLRVAVPAIVPIVLLAPPAVTGRLRSFGSGVPGVVDQDTGSALRTGGRRLVRPRVPRR
jgi:hypothetical protein